MISSEERIRLESAINGINAMWQAHVQQLHDYYNKRITDIETRCRPPVSSAPSGYSGYDGYDGYDGSRASGSSVPPSRRTSSTGYDGSSGDYTTDATNATDDDLMKSLGFLPARDLNIPALLKKWIEDNSVEAFNLMVKKLKDWLRQDQETTLKIIGLLNGILNSPIGDDAKRQALVFVGQLVETQDDAKKVYSGLVKFARHIFRRGETTPDYY